MPEMLIQLQPHGLMGTPIATLAVSVMDMNTLQFPGTHLQHLCYALYLKFPLHIARAYLYFKSLLEHHFLCVPLHNTSRWYS